MHWVNYILLFSSYSSYAFWFSNFQALSLSEAYAITLIFQICGTAVNTTLDVICLIFLLFYHSNTLLFPAQLVYCNPLDNFLAASLNHF